MLGPTNCAGRSLALHEMRTVLATLVQRFDVQFAPGFQPEDWTSQLKDQYILLHGHLPVVLNRRR
jgi:cytochrome P450